MNSKSSEELIYTGKVQPQPGELDENGQKLYPYLPSPELVEAVNLAIYLKRPLLLRGEPGCGKTQLAKAVQYELKLPFEAWPVKSTEKAQDGLYTYDAVGRLHDAQLARLEEESKSKVQNLENYIKYGALGRAFQNDRRTVVLIDEIDKADIDFPNDLLWELDERQFSVKETGRKIPAKAAPIIFITSNDEKALPDAFLRRCLFHFIKFPNKEQLIKIINAHFCTPAPAPSQILVEKAVVRFRELYEKMDEDKRGAGKKVSTSELIDWFRYLRHYPEQEALEKLAGKLLPYPSALLKNWEDYYRYYLSEAEGYDYQ